MSRMAELHQDITDMLACHWKVDAIARVLNIPEDWVRAVKEDLAETDETPWSMDSLPEEPYA